MAAIPHIEFPPPPARICKQCHEKQSIACFVRSQRSPDGYLHLCKSCFNARQAKYQRFDPREISRMIDRATGKAS